MNFLHQIVTLGLGQGVRVYLQGNAANVMLLSGADYQKYQLGQPFTYYGGHVTQSPAHLHPPTPGIWHLVVDLGGTVGNVSASFEIV